MIAFTMPILGDKNRQKFQWVPTTKDRYQAARNHGGQSLERLRERGGLSWCELAAVVCNRDWHEMTEAEAKLECEATIAGRRTA